MKKLLMPFHTVNVLSHEINDIYETLDNFLKDFPAYQNQLHNIKITRVKLKNNHLERSVLYPLTENDQTVMKRHDIQLEKPTDLHLTHSCTFIQKNEKMYAIFHQNKQEGAYYYHASSKMKWAAVFHYKGDEKKIELLYKVTTERKKNELMKFSKKKDCSCLHESIYFIEPIIKSNVIHKYIEFMYYIGLNLESVFRRKKGPINKFWNIWVNLLLSFAKLQSAGIVHGDIKLANICITSLQGVSDSTDIPFFIDIAGAHLEKSSSEKPQPLFTAGYVAPELFLDGHALTPKEQLKRKNFTSFMISSPCLTLATDIFAMGQVLKMIQEKSNEPILKHSWAKQLVTTMLNANPQDRPDLAYLFGYSTEKNANLKDHADLSSASDLKNEILSFKDKIDAVPASLHIQREEELEKESQRGNRLLEALDVVPPPLNQLFGDTNHVWLFKNTCCDILWGLFVCCVTNDKINPRSHHDAQYSNGSSDSEDASDSPRSPSRETPMAINNKNHIGFFNHNELKDSIEKKQTMTRNTQST